MEVLQRTSAGGQRWYVSPGQPRRDFLVRLFWSLSARDSFLRRAHVLGVASIPLSTAGCELDMKAATEILAKLKAISAAAEQGFGGTLRAASLLLTREMRPGGHWAVHLIDLAHYTETAEKRDDNFCDGLQNLVRTWEEWCAADPPQSWFTVCCFARK